MSYNTRNTGKHMYSPMGRSMGQRSPMGRGSPRMNMGRGLSRVPQVHSQQQQLTPIAPARPSSPLPKPVERALPKQQSPPQQQKPVEIEANLRPMSAFDPSSYTQPVFTTQQAYPSQQQIPVKQTTVQGALAQKTQQPPQQQAQKMIQQTQLQDQQQEAQKPAHQQAQKAAQQQSHQPQQAQKPAQQQTPQPQQVQKPPQQQTPQPQQVQMLPEQTPQPQQAQKPPQQQQQQTPQPQQAQKPNEQQQQQQTSEQQQQIPQPQQAEKPAEQQTPQQIPTQKPPQQQVTPQKPVQQQVPTPKPPQKSPQEQQEAQKPTQQVQQEQQPEIMDLDLDQQLERMFDLSKPDNTMTKQEASDDIEIVEDTDTGSGDKETPGRDGKKRFGRPWYRKGGAGFNVRLSKKIRKRRQNARLRHILCPKNAMMVLHELHPELKIVATEQLNAANQMVYTVEIEIEGKTYRGLGMSKLLAKQAGCETALKAVLLEKMAKSNVKVEPEPMKMEEDSTGNNGSSLTLNEDIMEIGESRPLRKNQAEDDVPWGSLASFALYKLFSDWQAQGYQLPVAATTNMIIPPAVPTQKMAPMKKIPEDANKKHPVQLLNQLRPGSQYSEKREGNPPNLTFTFTVVVDGQTYKGLGSSKKDAKKECAKSALIAMGVKYD